MTTTTTAAAPVTFSPGLRVDDALGAHALRQVNLRLRREVSWLWRERTVAGELSGRSALPPNTDKLAAALDLARFDAEKREFFARDDTAAWLSSQLGPLALSRGAPPPVRGSLGWVAHELSLAPVDVFVLALALTGVADAAAAQVFASCANDSTRTAPTLALAQRLWDEPSALLALLEASHSLARAGLLHPAPTSWDAPLLVPPLLARQLLWPEGDTAAIFTPLPRAKHSPPDTTLAHARVRAAAAHLRFMPVLGSPGASLAATAAAMGRDVATLEGSLRGETLATLLTLAWLRGHDVFLMTSQCPALVAGDDASALPDVPVTLFLGMHDRSALGRLPASRTLPAMEVAPLTYAERLAAWREGLTAAQRDPALDATLAECARRFRCERETIAHLARELGALGRPVLPADVFAACRADLDLGDLAQPVTPRFEAKDLMLPPKAARQLDELIHAMRELTAVHYEWGTARAWNEAGLTALFSGPPGTGKTMAAEVIAATLALPLYRIDLSQVVNKYIGETEKNLRRVFDAAEASDVILFFDEADALFGRRTEVKDAHDRYANLEVSYLLERMERFKGLAILATNRRGDLDEAFARRLRFAIEFPLPGPAERLRIWRRCIPADADASALDLPFLAERFALSGGHIRAIVFHACLQSARPGEPRQLTMPAVLRAVRGEYEKLNRPVSLEQFAPHAAALDA